MVYLKVWTSNLSLPRAVIVSTHHYAQLNYSISCYIHNIGNWILQISSSYNRCLIIFLDSSMYFHQTAERIQLDNFQKAELATNTSLGSPTAEQGKAPKYLLHFTFLLSKICHYFKFICINLLFSFINYFITYNIMSHNIFLIFIFLNLKIQINKIMNK